MGGIVPGFVQVAVAVYPGGGRIIVAVDKYGDVWEYADQYHGEPDRPGWIRLSMDPYPAKRTP